MSVPFTEVEVLNAAVAGLQRRLRRQRRARREMGGLIAETPGCVLILLAARAELRKTLATNGAPWITPALVRRFDAACRHARGVELPVIMFFGGIGRILRLDVPSRRVPWPEGLS